MVIIKYVSDKYRNEKKKKIYDQTFRCHVTADILKVYIPQSRRANACLFASPFKSIIVAKIANW